MIFYLTANEYYSGIYQGQVIDLVKFLRSEKKVKIRLICFLPLKGFLKNRKKIKDQIPEAIVLPSFPKQSGGKNWKKNKYLLSLFCILYKVNAIIARNTLSTNVALAVKKSGAVKYVCLDGRGAVSAEANEYDIYPAEIKKSIELLEKNAVLHSDYRIAITENLIRYWERMFQYKLNSHFIIPGTLNVNFLNIDSDYFNSDVLRHKYNFKKDDVILVYAGSTEGWQSFGILSAFIEKCFIANTSVKLLFLSKEEPNIKMLMAKFENRVHRYWVQPSEVPELMLMGDYGLIIREETVTNEVALPTKFPEYLACGLNVITSKGASEVAKFVEEHNCGFNLENEFVLFRTTPKQRSVNRELALKYYNKYSSNISGQYEKLIQNLLK